MRSKTWSLALFMGILALAVGLAGCATAPAPAKLKVGLLPIIDSLPFYVADQEGYFKEQGVDVELVTFSSALERDAALQAKQTDGQLADLIATGLLNKDQTRVKIVKETFRGGPEMAMISVLVGPNSPIKSAADLRGKEVAVSHNSLIEYLTDRLVAEAGVGADAVKKTEVTRIPVRMEMLAKGQVAAATLPEPLTTLAIQAGARVILSDAKSQIGLSVLEFRTETLQDNPEGVRRFVAAHEKAVKAINANRAKYLSLLAQKANLPASLATTFKVPPFPENKVPNAEDINQAQKWMLDKGL
ncbi:MAG: MetQ/NlpA family ABC transporter substrate-binding protein, partial [Dehalococcoidia bacterium]|nr:MetQ/NlpA family ABC transporter substrate-binding protein [Dehalococcoidia bacterium]